MKRPTIVCQSVCQSGAGRAQRLLACWKKVAEGVGEAR